MRLKLTGRLTAVLVGVTLLALACAAATYQVLAGNIFNQLVVAEASQQFITDVTAFYNQHGSLDNIDDFFRPQGQPPQGSDNAGPGGSPPGPGGPGQGGPPAPQPSNLVGGRPPGPRPAGNIAVGLADTKGVVVIPAGGYVLGQRAPASSVRNGISIRVNGSLIATTLPPLTPLPFSTAEAEFVRRTRVALAFAAAAGAALAAIVGLLIARGIVRPLRQLTAAAARVSHGEVATVPVKGDDEVADLGHAFNRMSADLDYAQSARKQMTADIAHELRNPLTTIGGYVEAFRDGDLEPTPERLDTVHHQTQRLSRIVEDLRTLTLADVGSLQLALRQVEADELLRAAADNYAIQAKERGVTVRFEAEIPLGPIEADAERLSQVLSNLVSNALRYTPAGGEIRITGRNESEAVVLSVEDTGEGIPPTDLPYIFERFYRAGEPSKRDSKGSGLGLAIVKAIVGAHRGSIEARSEPGVSTAFTIRLPRVQQLNPVFA